MADLVIGLAKSAVEGTLTMARSAVEEEKKLQKSVQRDLVIVSDEFEMMHAFLSTTKERVMDEMTRTLVRQVRNTALDVEDCIETVVHLDNRSNWWRRLLPACVPMRAPAASLDEAVANLELLKARVEAMGQRSMRYGLISKPPAEMTTPQTSAGGATNVLDILAEARHPLNKRRGPRDLAELISMNLGDGISSKAVCNGDGVDHIQLRVISVWGTQDDLETTSIVKKAYDDPDICRDFACRAWVRLTHPFNPHGFIRSLLAQFYTNKHGSTSTQDLLIYPAEVMVARQAGEGTAVEEFTNGRYLLVLEDVSKMVDWEAVRVLLPDKGNGSCIIVHTQQLEVASLCVGHSQRVVELEWISDDHSICAFFNDENNKSDKETAKIESAQEWLQGFQRLGPQTIFWSLKSIIRNRAIRCIPVCGIIGVGKSSLIRQVYYESVVEPVWTFQKFGWVDVPNPFDLREFSRNLLLDLHSGSLHRAGMLRIKDPVQECRGLLQEYSCLTVINGLQTTEEWDSIKDVLAGHSNQCLIVVIAHKESVARYCSKENWLHVEGLEFDEPLDLFRITVSKKIGPCALSHQVMKQAQRILPMCGGLPKVIIAVAEFVADRLYNEHRWSRLGDFFMKTLDEDIAFGSLRPQFAWVRSYFRSCPDFLKPCVFYLSIFPLNHRIRRRRLVRRWVAEGYARDHEECGAEEKAEEFALKLFLMSMIQMPGQRVLTVYMRMPLCLVNGFLREYMVSRSMEDKHIFALEGHCSATSQRTGRHLTVARSWDRDQLVFRSIDFSRLRSLTVFGQWEPFFVSDKMGLLRVLDLEDASEVTDKEVNRMLQLLPRLKFLSLRGCEGVTCLPDSSMGRMRHLETLDVRHTSVVTLPSSITKLPKLQYIRAGTNVPVLDDNNAGSFTATAEILPRPPSEAATTAAASSSSSSPSGPSTTRAPTAAAATTPVVSRVGCTQLWTRCCHRRGLAGPTNNGGVVAPKGIGQLMALRTLGVIDIRAATGRSNLKELRNLTQLRKLGVSGVNERNYTDLCSAISGHAQLESLSVRLDSGSQCCLNGVSSPPEDLRLKSLKLYGDAMDQLPSWTDKLHILTKLSLKMATVTQQGMDVLACLPKLRALRLHFKEFQDGELRFSKGFGYLDVLEVACNSRLQAMTFHPGVMADLEVLKVHCCNVSSIRFSGLDELRFLQEVWLSGSYGDQLVEHLKSQLNEHKRKVKLHL